MAKSTTAKPKSAKTAASKATVAKKTTATRTATKVKVAAPKAAPKPLVVRESTPVVANPGMKKKELIDTVVERSGIKKKDAKPVVEAMLAVLGEALGNGRELNLQPLGKVKINRAKDVQGGRILVTKIRQSTRVPGAKDPIVKAAE